MVDQFITIGSGHGVSDPDADWAVRAFQPGVFYRNDFDYADQAALAASSYLNMPNSSRASLVADGAISGKAMRIDVLKTDGEGDTGDYRLSFDGAGAQTKATVKKAFYFQFSIYLPSYILDHRFKTSDGGIYNHKWAIIQEPDQSFGIGEVVAITPFFRKCVGTYRLRSSTGQADTIWRIIHGSPGHPNTDYHFLSTIDAGPQSDGAGGTDSNTVALYKRRYGFIYDLQSGTTNYGTPLSAQGQPDADSAINGAAWFADDWNTLQFYVNQSTNTVKVWHARRGDPPGLIIDGTGTADLGNRSGNWTGAQLLPRLEERISDLTRQDTYAMYAEVIGSDNLINFPGGFVPPSA
jgi:hypothetical protein